MTKMILTRGIPASGKSTWAREWVKEAERTRVCRDDLRMALFGRYYPLTYEQEEMVTRVEREAVRASLVANRDVVVDAMHLRPKYIREWQKFAYEVSADLPYEVEVEVREFPITLELAEVRDLAREKSVGEEALRGIWSRFMRKGEFLPVENWTPEVLPEVEPYAWDPDNEKPLAVIVDIDGTVALNTGGRSYYDYTRVSEDTPNERVIDLVRELYRHGSGHTVIYCSGREDSCREDTELWIKEHVQVPGPLLMRATGDSRKDSEVKLEIFNNHIRNKYDVKYVIDDRSAVCKMWRSLGLTVFQVAEGNY